MTVGILGAGLQGVLCALELAERGHDIVIYDAADGAIRAASLHNEGKIHLGYVYAKDTTNKTSTLMAEGATRFSRLLNRWWPQADIEATASDPFDYLVLPDSLERAEWLSARYKEIDAEVFSWLSLPGRNYLSRNAVSPVRQLNADDLARHYNIENVEAAFRTEERAIDLPRMAEFLRTALDAHPAIECRWNASVESVAENANGSFSVKAKGLGLDGPFDVIVNALWSDRLRIDETLGIKVSRPYLFRNKVANHLKLPAGPGVRSVTMVIGPFGDFVSLPSGDCYLSWYPTGCLDRTQDISPPPGWAHKSQETLKRVFEESAHELSRRINGLGDLVSQAIEVHSAPGVIFCWGESDVDDPASELHLRHDVGVNTYRPGYHSVDTGKLTIAPIFAEEVANRVCPK